MIGIGARTKEEKETEATRHVLKPKRRGKKDPDGHGDIAIC